MFFHDGFRRTRGNLFDFHPAGRRGHDHHAAAPAIDKDARVQLARDGHPSSMSRRFTTRPSGPV